MRNFDRETEARLREGLERLIVAHDNNPLLCILYKNMIKNDARAEDTVLAAIGHLLQENARLKEIAISATMNSALPPVIIPR